MTLIHTSNRKIFALTEGETVLGATLRANVMLAHSCRTRTTIALHEEIGFSQPERDAG